MKLCYETLDNIFENNYVHSIYNPFLNPYLRVFYSSFPLRKLITKTNSNAWTTMGIRNSCKHKRDLYLQRKNSNDGLLKIIINYIAKFCQMT